MLVYLAGPSNDLAHNLRQATLMANELLIDGHVSIGLYLQQNLRSIAPRTPEEMLLIAQSYIEKSDVFFAMRDTPNTELQIALDCNKPVFEDYRKLLEFFSEGSDDRA